MHKLFASLLLIFLLVGCSTDDSNSEENNNNNEENNEENSNDNQNDPPSTLLLTGYTYTAVDDQFSFSLEYTHDSQGRLIKAVSNTNQGTGGTSDYNYSNGRLISIDYSNGETRSFSYEGDLIVYSEQTNRSWQYTYDSNDRLIQINEFLGQAVQCTEDFNYVGNSENYVSTFRTCEGINISVTYDDKNNPYRLGFLPAMIKVFRLTPNNPLENEITGAFMDSFEYVYEYNSDDYPTTAEGYRMGELQGTYEFFYDN